MAVPTGTGKRRKVVQNRVVRTDAAARARWRQKGETLGEEAAGDAEHTAAEWEGPAEDEEALEREMMAFGDG